MPAHYRFDSKPQADKGLNMLLLEHCVGLRCPSYNPAEFGYSGARKTQACDKPRPAAQRSSLYDTSHHVVR